MSRNTIEIQDGEGNVYYPHTSADVVFFADGSSIQTLKPQITNVGLTASGWTGTGPYTQAVSIGGVTANSLLYVSPGQTITNINEVAKCRVLATSQASGSVTFTAYDGKPSINLVFMVINNGDV